MLCGEADDVVLFQGIEFLEHFIIIVAPVQSKGSFAKQGRCALHVGKSHIIYGSEIFFFGGMDFGKDTDQMVILCQDTGFCYVIALLINAFNISAFGAVPDKAEGFKVISMRLYDIRFPS